MRYFSRSLRSVCFLSALWVLVGLPADAAIPNTERQALVDLYNATGGPAWHDAANWNGPAGTECTWAGVRCDGAEQHVTGLLLRGNHLIGTLPDSIGDLTQLISINLSQNGLSGLLPTSIGQWTVIVEVVIEGNDLTGPIPSVVGQWAQLERLLLGGNGLTGPLPTEIGSLLNLRGLSLGNNQLSGTIPLELGDLPNLTGLNLANNNFTGSIPLQLADLTALEALSLGGNLLHGPIPSELAQLQLLHTLNLSNNALSGPIPAALGDLQLLRNLFLNSNQLSGPIPFALLNLQVLESLDLNTNQLSGQVYPEFADLTQLRLLQLGMNQLTGEIPPQLGDLEQLEELYLHGNQLSGELPPELAAIEGLQRLVVTNNQLSGSISPLFGDLEHLNHFLVDGNQFSGSIPPELGQATSLILLRMEQNQLTGTIPPELGNLTQLTRLTLDQNQLSGPIPFSLGNLVHLERLGLSNNQLSGAIPSSLGQLAALESLQLSTNGLTGPLPSELGQLVNLENFAAAINHLDGPIPSSFGQMASLEVLNLSQNRLAGAIPDALGNASTLRHLFLSGNRLTPPIPLTLQNLTHLEANKVGMYHNLLETSDGALAAFLDGVHTSDWRNTQTVAPSDVAITGVRSAAVDLSWTPIPYQANGGGYVVSYGTVSGGPYSPFGITAGKSVGSLTVTGLAPETTYFFVVQSRTEAHNTNQSVLTSGFSAEISATTAPAGQEGHWPLDDGVGSVATDVSGNGNDGTLVNGPVWVTEAQLAGGLDFDGANDYVLVTDPGNGWELDFTTGLTLSVWIRPDTVGPHQALISKDNAFELEMGLPSADAYSLRLDNALVGRGTTPLVQGLWHHLAVTYDGAAVSYYLNGQPDGSFATSFPLIQNDVPLGFGARPPSGGLGTTFHFDGLMDDVQLYPRALSAPEVATLFAAGGSVPDVLAPQRSALAPTSTLPAGSTSVDLTLTTDESAECRYGVDPATPWTAMSPFTTTGGTQHGVTVSGLQDDTVFDYYVRCSDTIGNINPEPARIAFGVSSSADIAFGVLGAWGLDDGAGCGAVDGVSIHDGVLGPDCVGGDAPQWVAGRVGQGLQFDGSGVEVVVADHPDFASLGAVSMSAWIRHPATPSFKAIIDRRSQGVDGFDLFLDNTSRLFVRVDHATLHGDQVVADGQWHHVAAVHDGADLVLYVDGLEDRRQTVGPVLIDTAAPLYFGRYFDNPNQFNFSGTLDEVRLYDRALSSVEVLEVFQLAP